MKLRVFAIATALVAVLGAGASQAADKLTVVNGVTEPFLDVTLSANVPGTVAKHHFKEGDSVKQGDPVISLDQRLEKLEVDRRKLISDSKVEVNAAAEQVKTLKSLLESTQKLYETTKSISREEVAKKELEYKQAIAEYDRLMVVEDRELIEYEQAQEQLRKRTVVSPLTGTVARIFLQVGEDCRAQEALVRLVDVRQCYLVCNVEARAGYLLKEGTAVKLEVEAGNSYLAVPGKITYVSPIVDQASGLLRVKAIFDNADGKVRPGVGGRMYLEEAADGK
jgi:RND family efflux transporter MFP subunit